MSRQTQETGFYNSAAWKTTRRNYKQSVGGLCERCLRNGLVNPAEVVHHIEPLTEQNISDIKVSLCWSNLEALCRKCHAEVHDEMYAKRTGRRYKVDGAGRVVMYDDTVL